MRKAKRNAMKLEAKVQELGFIKVSGNADEKPYARRKLADGMTSRYVAPTVRGLSTVKDTVKVPEYRKAMLKPSACLITVY